MPSTFPSMNRAGGMAIIAPQRKAARRRNQGSRSKRSMKLTSRKMQTAGTAGMKMGGRALDTPYSARGGKVMGALSARVMGAVMASKRRAVAAVTRRVRL